YEILWYRVLSVMTRGVASTFGLLLAAYLAGIAIGSRVSTVFCKGDGGSARQLRLLALFVAISNAIAAFVVPAFAWSAKFTDYRIGLAVVAVGAAFLGSVLPLVSHFGIAPDERAGSRLSYVYLANIIGSASGSLITGFVMMDRMSTQQIALALVVAGFVLSAALAAMGGLRGREAAGGYGLLAAAMAGAVLSAPRPSDPPCQRL